MADSTRSEASSRVGYAVVGLGWIAQAAMLPAFANAGRNSRLVALVSGDEGKRSALAHRYGLPADATFDYDNYESCLERDDVDAVYIALPNHLHREYTVRAARKGVHVLCEKPLAVTEADCRAMIDACHVGGVRLMTAYRLHFEPATLFAIGRVQEQGIGRTRLFSSTFAQQVSDGDVRLMPTEQGGGPLYDMGIYCLNAARYLFRAEPLSVRATATATPGDRFEATEEAVTCVLEFPDQRVASFTCSFGAYAVSVLDLVGEVGSIRMDAAYEFQGARTVEVSNGEEGEKREFPETDQFGPQLLHFSDCVLEGRDPDPDGHEGLVDVTVIRAAYRSIETGGPVSVDVHRDGRPRPDGAIVCPAVESPEMVGASGPSD